MADPWEENYAPPAEPWNATYVQPKQNKGTLGDIGTSLKRGVEELPGIVTGLADIAPALAFNTRPFTRAAEAAGEATGFQPAKWAEAARAEYSPGAQQAAQEVQQTWESPTATWGEKLGQYARHPGYVAQQIAESLPSMAAGGVGSRALMLAGRAGEAGVGTLERTVGTKMAAPVAAGVGEGAVQTGQSMEQSKDAEDARKAAVAALGSGIVDAVIGAGAGRLAGKMGLETAETAMAKGFNNAIEKEMSLGRRVAGGAVSEGLLQELPQSAQEQMWQNYAEGKPVWEGVERSAIEGALAGFVMGAGANLRGGKTAPAPTAPAAPAAPAQAAEPGITMAPPGAPITEPAAMPEGAIPYERVAPAGVELAPAGAPLTEAAKVAGIAPQAPSNWELAPAGSPMSAPYEALRLPHYKYDTQIVFADGSTGTQHQVDQHLASLPEAQRVPELARMLQGAYVAPATAAPAVPHPDAAPGSLKAAVNAATTTGAIPTTPQLVSAQAAAAIPLPPSAAGQPAPPIQETQNAIRQPSPESVGAYGRRNEVTGREAGGGVRQAEQGAEAAQARRGSAAAETGRTPAAEVTAPSAIRPHVATLVARKSLVDQTVPGLLDKAKQALTSGQGKASDFTKAAALFPAKEEPIRAALRGIAEHLQKPTVKAAVAKAQHNLSVGKTALSTEPITVRGGVVHIGEYPAADYETGKDITVPEDATPQQIREALVHGGAIAKGLRIFGAGKAEKVMFSRETTAAGRVANLWKTIASDPKSFKYGEVDKSVSSAEDIAKQVSSMRAPIAGREVDNGALFTSANGALHVVPHGDKRNSEGGYAEYVIQAPGAKSEGKLEGGGAAMYQAAQLWVHANGGKFVGDDHLSEVNKLRVTSNQLSNALRTGTTEHIVPDKDQGVRGWKEGNTDNNIAALALREMELAHERIPALNTLSFDIDRNRIVDSRNAVVMADEVRKILSRTDPQFARGVGFTTAIRALATRAALRQEGGRGLTGEIGLLRDNAPVGGEALLYERGESQLPLNPHTPQSLRKALIAAHSGAERVAVEHMLNTGEARTITSDQAANLLGDELTYGQGGLTRAFFSPSNNTTYFIADHFDRRNATPAALRGIVRHEVSVHAYQLGKSSAEFKDILRQLDMMRRAGNAQVKEAYARVPPKTAPEDIHEEALSYLIQHAPEMGIVRRIIAWLRNTLREMGLTKWAQRLSSDDLLHMAQSALTRATVVERETGFNPKLSVHAGLDERQAAAVDRVFGKPKTVVERAKEFRSGWRKSLEQGIFDQYAPIKDITLSGYIKARMSKGGDSTLEAVFMYGKPKLDENGDIKVEFDKANKGMNGYASVLAKLDGEHDRFLKWVAGTRAESLKAVGLENLMTDEDIAALKTLNEGTLSNGEDRKAAYAKALKETIEYNNAALNIAYQRGLISDETRQMYRETPYVPFYRLADEGAVEGFTAQAGMVNQYAWKKLSGGTNKINEDLLANMLQNWSHLITASARNDAAKTTLEEAVRVGAATEIPSGHPTKGAVVFRENNAEGRNIERAFLVTDPHLLNAITSLGAVVRVPKPLRMFKHYLTMGVTVNPAFKIRNLVRDSVQSMALADLSLNPAANLAQGAKLTARESETRAQMLAAGGIIRFGSMLEGNTADMGRELVEKLGVPKDHVLDDSNKIAKFWKHTVKPAFDAYQELGDRGEQINRAALYDQLIKKGMTHGEAAYWARDLMDFSMSGSWTAIRFLTQTVPFMNARLQGLYKLGRSAQADKKRFGIVLGGVTMASLALLAAYHDDDDWKKREDWDRDNFWWFKIGGKAFYLPKPFEVGAIATIAERTAELMSDDEMTGKRFSNELFTLVNNQLSMNPTPQALKPLIDLWANKDSFTGKPIETVGMEKLRPEDRYKQSTSGIARVLSELGMPNPTQLAMGNYEQMSPVQIDHLIRGYFSWIGTSATVALDYGIFRPLEKTERPAMQMQDVFLAGNFVKDLPAGSSRYVSQMYEQAKEIEQAYNSYRAALKAGETEKAAGLMESEGEKIRKYHLVEAVKRAESNWSARARMIERSNLSADQKREALTKIEAERDRLARRIKP